jgi:biotin carboxyl carrier protein
MLKNVLVASEVNGRIEQIRVQVGDQVQAGDVLAVLESMKMEIALEAPSAGRVVAVLAEAGQVAQEGQNLFELG